MDGCYEGKIDYLGGVDGRENDYENGLELEECWDMLYERQTLYKFISQLVSIACPQYRKTKSDKIAGWFLDCVEKVTGS